MAATVPASVPVTASSNIDQLRAQRAALVAQLQAATQNHHDASAQLANAEQTLGTAQDQLASARNQLDQTNAQLATLTGEIASDQTTIAKSKVELVPLIRATYEGNNSTDLLNAVLSTDDFITAMDRLKSAAHISQHLQDLIQQLIDSQKALVSEQAALQTDSAQALSLETQLQSDSNKFAVSVANRDLALQNSDANVRNLVNQITNLDQQINGGITANSSPPPNSGGTCGNHFAYGFCTWYVASRRCVPWFGNAWQWASAAQAMGYTVDMNPSKGGIVVFGRGGSSPLGHVAYIENVGTDGSVYISEMNYGAWDHVDDRTLPPPDPKKGYAAQGIIGFIH